MNQDQTDKTESCSTQDNCSSTTFTDLMKNQRNFQLLLGFDDYEENPAYIKEQVIGLVAEVHEALNECPWKPWKKNMHMDVDKFTEELVDCQLFLMNLILASGCNPEMFMGMCRDKQIINIQRQVRGY